jgi:hypothetical protein
MALGTAVTVNHSFVSGKADGADPTFVQPSKWNAAEVFGAGSDGQIVARDSSQTNGASWVDPFLWGNATIQVNSTTQIQLNLGQIPLKVGGVWINRRVTAVVTLSPTVSANTTYFVYAFDNAGVTTLEAVVTGHSTDSAAGVEIKTGDATRTLVGMIRANNSGNLVDAGSQRFAISWFNRKPKFGTNNFASNKTTTSASAVEIDNTTRVEYLTWSDSDVNLSGSAPISPAGGTTVCGILIAVDGSAVNSSLAFSETNPTNAFNAPVSGPVRSSEGYHHADLFGFSDGTRVVTFQGGTAGNTSVTQWNVQVQG